MTNNLIFMHLNSRIIPVHKILDVYPIVADNLTGIEIQDKVGIIEINMSFRDFSATLKDVINNNLNQGDNNVEDNNCGREDAEKGNKSPDSGEIQSRKNDTGNNLTRGQDLIHRHGSGDAVDPTLEGGLDRNNGGRQDKRLADIKENIVVDKRTKQDPKS